MGVNIDIYLRNAFKELDAFSLPGIGTFRKVHLSATLDDEQQKVYPPKVDIEFSPQVDTRLSFTRYLTQQIQMRQEEAERIVRDICGDIERIIKEEGQFSMPEIGSLYKKPDGKYDFVPDQQSQEIFSADLFGLEPVALRSLPKENEEYLSLESEENTMTQTVSQKEEKPQNRRSGLSALSLVLALLIVGTVAVFVWQNQYLKRSSLQDKQFLSIVASETESDQLIADKLAEEEFETEGTQPNTNASSRLEEDKENTEAGKGEDKPANTEKALDGKKTNNSRELIAQAEGQKTRAIDEGLGLPRGDGNVDEEGDGNIGSLDKTTARLAKPTPTYHLITGSFGSNASAEKYKAKLEKQGFKQIEILHAPELGKYRVSVFSSASSEEVSIFKKTLQTQRDIKGWIWEQK